jgi:arylsulfatase A-like enzyme
MRARRAEGRRFLAFVNDVEPHAPWTPPDEFQSAFVRPGTSPEAVAEARTLRHPRTSLAFAGREQFSDAVRHAASDLYDAEIAGLDAEVGRLLDTMRAEGLLRNTLVVITSDHGEGLGDHGWMEHGVLLHRELLRVPLLVRPPGGCAPHTVRDVVRLHDVFATVLESCGLPVPPQTESRSLLADTRDRIALASERTREDMCRGIEQMTSPAEAAKFRIARSSVFDGRFHLMVDETGATELYDVTSDPAERTNVADAEPGTVSRLRARLDVR